MMINPILLKHNLFLKLGKYFFNIVFLLSVYSSVEASVIDEISSKGAALKYSQEVYLWPKGSNVLTTGIEIINNDIYKNNKPELVITHPSYLLYQPLKNTTNAAVIVFAGGGYKSVAIGKNSTLGLDGFDVCNWLTGVGMTCVLVKYRVPNTGCNYNKVLHKHVTPDIPLALQDAQRTISMVRYHADQYNIDPNKIGVMGFSAGGNLAVLSSTGFNKRSYDAVDDIDLISSRPDFAIAVYAGHMTMEHKNKKPRVLAAQQLNSDIVIAQTQPTDIPPTLLIHAKDDQINPVHFSKVYERALKKVGANVTLKLYEDGGHAFGVKKQSSDSDQWMDDAFEWLGVLNIIKPKTDYEDLTIENM